MATDEHVSREEEHSQVLLKIIEDIDSIKEECHLRHKSLRFFMEMLYDYLEAHFGVRVGFLRTQDESLCFVTLSRGMGETLLQAKVPTLFDAQHRETVAVDGLRWFAKPLDMAGNVIGTFGLAFPEAVAWTDDQAFAVVSVVAEELDDYLFTIQESRIKHMTILEIQRCLKARMLNDAIERSIAVMTDYVAFEDIIVLYVDDDLGGKKIINYMIFENSSKVFDSWDHPHPTLDQILARHGDGLLTDNRELEAVFPVGDMTETILIDGLLVETPVGKILMRPPKEIGFSMASRELVEVFAESLRQRLMDFNREKNMLRQFFSTAVTHRLLAHANYLTEYLSPRQENIGIVYADICGFTKMSEQVLRHPKLIASFIDTWSKEVVMRLHPLGAALDKIVGDCLILLFGPPFYDQTPEDIVGRALEGAMLIRTMTEEFLHRPVNKIIQDSPFFPDFGVAIGVNYCPATVGLIGPNQDLTAFSSGMNNTARLQGVAHSGEILVTTAVQELATKADSKRWQFEGPMSAKLKNVKDPLPYFRLLTK